MKFREYDNLFVKVFRCRKPEDLEWVIQEAATQYNLIDLQYSTTNIDDKGNVEYSVIVLLQEKNL